MIFCYVSFRITSDQRISYDILKEKTGCLFYNYKYRYEWGELQSNPDYLLRCQITCQVFSRSSKWSRRTGTTATLLSTAALGSAELVRVRDIKIIIIVIIIL